MKVYGKDGTEYESEEQAIAAGVQDYSYVKIDPSIANATTNATANATNKPAAVANIPTYGYELQQLMNRYGVNSPTAPKTTDQTLLDQYFKKVSAPMYDQPTGNSLYNTYLGMGLGQLPGFNFPMANFYSGQAVAPAGFRYDPVTNTNVSVTDPGGVASAGRITTGTPNIGGNQCPPGFNFDPVSRSCIPTPETGLLTGGQSQSAQQPMPNCPPNTTLDPVNRICVPKGCPAGYEQDATGNCVAKSMQTPCPPGFTRDATGVCIPPRVPECPPNTTKNPATGECVPKSCPAGYEMDATGNCVAKSMQNFPCPPGFERDASGVCLPILRQALCPDGKPRDYFGNCATTEEPPIVKEPRKEEPPIVKEPRKEEPPILKEPRKEEPPILKEPTRCPEGFEKDATGNCVPKIDKTPCQDGYIRNAAGQCVPDPEQEAFFRKHFGSADAGEYDIYNAMRQGTLSENLVRDFAGNKAVDEWLAKNVDPDKSFSKYAIQNLAAQGDFDDPNEANRGSQRGANRVFDLYQQGAMGLGEIEEAMGEQAVQDWMRANQPEEYARVYAKQQPVIQAQQPVIQAQPQQAAQQFSDNEVRDYITSIYNQYGGAGVEAHRAIATAMNQFGVSPSQVARVTGYSPEEVEADYKAFGFKKGGAVNFEDLAGKYQVGGMPTQPPMTLPDDELQQMAMRYQSPAQERYDAATQSLRKTIEDMAQAKETPRGPSKAEMYFRLASAFTAPTKTGSFFENLGLAGQEMAGVASERRAAESAASQQRRDLALELGKFDVDTAAQMLRSEQDIAARERGFDLQRDRLDQSIAQQESQSGRMSTTELRMLEEAEQQLLQGNIAIEALTKAKQYSEQAFTKYAADVAAKNYARLTNPDDERLVATDLMEQLIKINALQSLKMMFGGNPTEGERAELMATQGLNAESVVVRDGQIDELMNMALERRDFLIDRINRIKSREMRAYDDTPVPTNPTLEQPTIEMGV